MSQRDLQRLFDPQAIAVIGASQAAGSISGQPVAHLKNHGFRGRVYPVNPKYEEIGGYTAYPAVSALPEEPDLALIVVNASRVPAVLRECGEKRIPFAIVFGSGFGEAGEKGAHLQREVDAIAAEYGIGVVGPNCQGMMNIADDVYAGFGSAFKAEAFRPGPVSMVTQSGGFGYSMAGLAQEAGLGFRKIMSLGNEAGLTSIDFMHHFVEDPGTKIVAAYIEGLRDAHRIAELGSAALRRRKPLLIWKVGTTDVGQRAAAAHTGSLGGDSVLYDAAFKQKGIIQIHDVQDLLDYGKAFLHGKYPRGKRVAVVSVSGGAGVVLADQCAHSGLELPTPASATIEKLRGLLPPFSSLINPIDVTASVFGGASGHAVCRQVLQAALDDPGVDSLIVAFASLNDAPAARAAQEIVALDCATDKPLFVSWSARETLAAEAFRILEDATIPFYRTPMHCARSLGVLSEFAEACRREEAERSAPILVLERSEVRSTLRNGHGCVAEHEAKRVLREYGIATTREELAGSRQSTRRIAARIGYPVAIKVQSPDLPHKTEADGIRLGITSDGELDRAYGEILENVKRYNPSAHIEGVLVQEMVKNAIEVILGIVNKPQFGPAVMFGLGGIFTEVLKDVSFRFAPISNAVAMEMIREIKGYKILEGVRGRAGYDVETLAETITRLAAMAIDLKDEVAALDINPMFVLPSSAGVMAGDALIVRAVE